MCKLFRKKLIPLIVSALFCLPTCVSADDACISEQVSTNSSNFNCGCITETGFDHNNPDCNNDIAYWYNHIRDQIAQQWATSTQHCVPTPELICKSIAGCTYNSSFDECKNGPADHYTRKGEPTPCSDNYPNAKSGSWSADQCYREISCPAGRSTSNPSSTINAKLYKVCASNCQTDHPTYKFCIEESESNTHCFDGWFYDTDSNYHMEGNGGNCMDDPTNCNCQLNTKSCSEFNFSKTSTPQTNKYVTNSDTTQTDFNVEGNAEWDRTNNLWKFNGCTILEESDAEISTYWMNNNEPAHTFNHCAGVIKHMVIDGAYTDSAQYIYILGEKYFCKKCLSGYGFSSYNYVFGGSHALKLNTANSWCDPKPSNNNDTNVSVLAYVCNCPPVGYGYYSTQPIELCSNNDSDCKIKLNEFNPAEMQKCPLGMTSHSTEDYGPIPADDINKCFYKPGSTKFCDAKGCFSLTKDVDTTDAGWYNCDQNDCQYVNWSGGTQGWGGN